MVVFSVGCAGSDSAEAPGPVNARSTGPHDWKWTRREIICKEDSRSAVSLKPEPAKLRVGTGFGLGNRGWLG